LERRSPKTGSTIAAIIVLMVILKEKAAVTTVATVIKNIKLVKKLI
jgi:hypothetical protein